MREILRSRIGVATHLIPDQSLNDPASVAELRRAIDESIEAGHLQIVLDLAGVPVVDSEALETLLWAQTRLLPAGGELKVANANATIQDVLRITGVHESISSIDARASEVDPAGDAPRAWRPLGELLVAKGLVTEEQVQLALEIQQRTGDRIAQILVKRGKAFGVVLEGGEEVRATAVASTVDPKRTFLKMLGPGDAPPEFVEQIRNFKMRGSSGKVNLALDGLPKFSGLPDNGRVGLTDIMVSPSMDYLERAYDEAKYGKYSRRPFLEIVFPSAFDPSMAPPGKHVASIFIQYAPYDLKEGHWEDHREAFGDTVVNTLSEYAPNLKNLILHRQVLSPWDLEQEFGLTEGNIFHGELTPDQLFMLRPAPGWAQYRMPVRNLYMCGSGAHPGGGVMGAPGRLAAFEMLKDFQKGKL